MCYFIIVMICICVTIEMVCSYLTAYYLAERTNGFRIIYAIIILCPIVNIYFTFLYIKENKEFIKNNAIMLKNDVIEWFKYNFSISELKNKK